MVDSISDKPKVAKTRKKTEVDKKTTSTKGQVAKETTVKKKTSTKPKVATNKASSEVSLNIVKRVDVAVVGAGCGGLAAAYKLHKEGFYDFVVLEKANEVGGAWRENTYPGCTCDIPSNLYSFSFAQNPNWSRAFAKQPEIYQYLQNVSHQFGLRNFIHFNTAVTGAYWQEATQEWHLHTSKGIYIARFLIGAAGPLHAPKLPAVKGINDFKGAIFHSSQWDHSCDLTGKKVAVVGSGASAIQLIPEIQPIVDRLYVLQRTPQWILPKANFNTSAAQKTLFNAFPQTQQALREALYRGLEMFGYGFRYPALMKRFQKLAELWIHSQIKNPELRAKVTPDYVLGCKRVLLSNNYFKSLDNANVDVITGGLQEVKSHSVIAADGKEYDVDVIVLATGFETTDSPLAKGIFDGQGRSMESIWGGSPQAYLGTTVSGFPNLFIILGPNVAVGHSSAIVLIEAQVNYIVDALKKVKVAQKQGFSLKESVQIQFNEEVQNALKNTVWNAGGCSSYYIDKNGKNTGVWPWSTFRFVNQLKTFDLKSYDLI